MDSWPATATRMFFDEVKSLLEIFATLQPFGVTHADIVREIKDQLTSRCLSRRELIASHLNGVFIEIDHEATLTPESSPDVKKYSLATCGVREFTEGSFIAFLTTKGPTMAVAGSPGGEQRRSGFRNG